MTLADFGTAGKARSGARQRSEYIVGCGGEILRRDQAKLSTNAITAIMMGRRN